MTRSAVIHRTPDEIRFPVEPATDPLPEVRTHEALATLLETPVESACDYSANVVANVATHPLLAAVHLAFAGHRPLVLSPDVIWLALVQGFAHHVAAHPEEHRARLVPHAGKKTIVVTRPDFVRGSPENAWPEVFSAFGEKIRAEVNPEGYDLVVDRFSTTGPLERAAFEVALMARSIRPPLVEAAEADRGVGHRGPAEVPRGRCARVTG